MRDYEAYLCEWQSEFFKKGLKRFSCGSAVFIRRYMKSSVALNIDLGRYDDGPLLANHMNEFASLYPKLNEEGGERYSEKEIAWIGYAYRAWAIISQRRSRDLVTYVKPQQMVQLYPSFHTFGIDYCVERLEDLVPPEEKASDYEIFKSTYKSTGLL